MSRTGWVPIPWLLGHYEISGDGQMRSVARIGHDGRRLPGRQERLEQLRTRVRAVK